MPGTRAVELLGELIRIDTSNPPGNERPAQELLADELAGAGFDCELLAAEPERPNLLARLRGAGDGPTLALIGHTDVVPAVAAEWAHDPFSGELIDGEIWGRGALDMKGQVAAEVAGVCTLVRGGWRPARGELLLVILADEEMSAVKGAQWLCREHPEKARCDLLVNEGGGARFELGGRSFYPLAIGEKGVTRLALRARGRAGHASQPGIGDNALVKLAPVLARLSEQPPLERSEAVDLLLATLTGDDGAQSALERVRELDAGIAASLVEPMLGVTVSPTMARASNKENVIPSVAEVLLDCRLPPGRGAEGAREAVAALLGEGDYELEPVEEIVGTASEADTVLAATIGEWLADADPGATLVPVWMAGFSDSHWFRSAFGCVAYGFCPQREMPLLESAKLIHSADERVPVSDVELAAGFFESLPPRVLGS